MSQQNHTIVLLQKTQNRTSRTFMDYDTLELAIEEIIKMFETRLKELNPSVRNINYDINDLHHYIDTLGDISCLVFSPYQQAYVPHDREWIKSRILAHLRRVANQR
ncbi:rudimentary enhancer [Gonapodya prolifera JEL478]|uniref:Enhancer of rudimentary homolog n=1 Tax=Gonapodya prolifera (strain JEL478) TaxID=1344416 RepID=A0A139AJY0_GONPJ|nr:rudimentary enhancer [Gonapodya prolifera JEL478]|eukprot:KXS17092.1 rudimentary enhancer [Gonapodya prolifera JEL478]